MRCQLRVLATASLVSACSSDAAVCDGPLELSDSVVVAPFGAAAVPGDDRTLLVGDVTDPAGPALHARCVGSDGAALAGDAVLSLEQAPPVHPHAALGEDGRYRVAWEVPTPVNRTSVFVADVDCSAGWSAPRQLVNEPGAVSVGAITAAPAAFATTLFTDAGLVLHIDRGAAGTAATLVATGGGEGLIAWNGQALAVIAVDGLTTYGLDGARLTDPVALPLEPISMCWDGSAWSLFGRLGDSLAYARVSSLGEPVLAPVDVASADLAAAGATVACGPGGVTVASMRATGGMVPTSTVKEAVITMAELAFDGAFRTQPTDLEPPLERLSMFPRVSSGARIVVSWESYGVEGTDQRLVVGERCAAR